MNPDKERDEYIQMLKEVFGNPKGAKLLDTWQMVFGDRPSYYEGVPQEEVYAREGERRFFLGVKNIVNS